MHPDFQTYGSAYSAKAICDFCVHMGVIHAVISPGSRNAPLIKAFTNEPGIECLSIADERSAGYIAMGIAQQLNQPVAIICTSGTAALNYAPAMAEAYYQHIPIIAITADRPPEWIDQMDGQAIRQNGIFTNFTEFEVNLKVLTCNMDFSYNIDLFNKAQNKINHGPVHINAPFAEPLYQFPENYIPSVFDENEYTINQTLSDNELDALKNEFSQYKKVLVIAGQDATNTALNNTLNIFNKLPQVLIINEHLSNLTLKNSIDLPELFFAGIKKSEYEAFSPELLISFGGPVLSKRMKLFLRNNKPVAHWRIDDRNEFPDTYQCLSKAIRALPHQVLAYMTSSLNSEYKSHWLSVFGSIQYKHLTFCEKLLWSDMLTYKQILAAIPQESIVHLGNSSVVRYLNLFRLPNTLELFSNRGTSGIDGVLSTAIGAAMAKPENTHTLLIGDISFVYDSNAFWNRYPQQNLKIIVINNQGGNIFRLIPGPDTTGALDDYFETHVPVNLKKLVESFGYKHLLSEDTGSLKENLAKLYSEKQAIVLEIKTNGEYSAQIWKEFFNTIT